MRTPIGRRGLLIGAGAAGACALPLVAPWRRGLAAEDAAPGPTAGEGLTMAALAGKYLDEFDIPALSVAVARHGQFVYRAAFGFADVRFREAATPEHRFRIASVTKPITSAAIYALIEEGKVALDDRVFAPGGCLQAYLDGYASASLQQVTVHQLLTHTSGGWPNDASDPMFRDAGMSQRDLITRVLSSRPPDYAPGTHWAYSNFGYCLLGRVIEAASGLPYAEYVKRRVLSRSNAGGMAIAGNTPAEREMREVAYYARGDGDPYGMNVTRMDSHGGWIASATDLVQFVMHVDGFGDAPPVLSQRSIQAMTATVAASAAARYASGWNVNGAPNWWHTGSLPGTTAIAVRTASGMCWAALANARRPGSDRALDRLMWKLVKAVPAWRG